MFRCTYQAAAPLRRDQGAVLSARDQTSLQRLSDTLREEALALRAYRQDGLPFLVPAGEQNSLEQQLQSYHDSFLAAMRSDPGAALQFLPAPSEREVLGQFGADCLPSPLAVEGRLEVWHADDFAAQKSYSRYLLNAAGGSRYVLHLAKLVQPIESGTKIRLTSAFALNQEVLVGRYEVLAQPGNPPVSGPQRVVSLMVQPTVLNPPDHPNQPVTLPPPRYTAGEVADVIFGEPLDNFFRESSYGQAWLAGANGQPGSVTDVFGLFPIETRLTYHCAENEDIACDPTVSSVCTRACVPDCNFREIALAAVRAADPTVPFSQYNRAVMFLPPEIPCPWSGAATRGKLEVDADGATLNLSLAGMKVSGLDYGRKVIGHELGHNFGVGHATFWQCAETWDLDAGRVEACQEEYGDPFDVMGKGSLVHHTAVLKEAFGWIGDSADHRVVAVTGDGTYALQPLERGTPGNKAIKLRHGPTEIFPFLYLEAREAVGLDADLKLLFGQVQPVVLAHYGPLPSLDSALVDPYRRGGAEVAVLRRGDSFNDPNSGSTITIGTPTAAGVPVTVDVQRTDFDGPKLQLTEYSRPDGCTVVYELAEQGQDPAGISRGEVYLRDSRHRTEDQEVFPAPALPFRLAVDLRRYTNGYIGARVWDNASRQGGSAPDNLSVIGPINLVYQGCATPPPAVRFSFAGSGFSYDSRDHEPDEQVIKGDDNIWTYRVPTPIPVRNPVTIVVEASDPDNVSVVDLTDLDGSTCKNRNGVGDCTYIGEILSQHPTTDARVERTFEMQQGGRLTLSVLDQFYDRTEINFTTELLAPTAFLRGDANGDRELNISDPVFLLNSLFHAGSPQPSCQDAADANDDGSLDISDGVKVLRYLFGDIAELPAPGGVTAGPDPTSDTLGCVPSVN